LYDKVFKIIGCYSKLSWYYELYEYVSFIPWYFT